jgi:hypothetical protein
MKYVTFSADEALIEAARARARAERTTLGEQFRRWLSGCAMAGHRAQGRDAVVVPARGKLQVGDRLSREEMNER